MNIIKTIEVFGDSILKGIQIHPVHNRYFVDNHIDLDAIRQKHSVSIENHSRIGCTIGKGYELSKKRLNKGALCDVVVMDFGGNDCDFNWKAISENPTCEHQPKTPIDEFVRVYHEMIEVLKKHSILPVLTTLPPLSPQKFFDWFCKGLNKDNVLKWLGGDVNAIYRFQENYSRTVEKIVRDSGAHLVDLRGAFLRERHLNNLLCEDGTHPNTNGQKIITAAFLEFAENLATSRAATRALGFA